VIYDIVEGEEQVVRRPDVLVVEGLNVLQPGAVADHFDLTLYVDADESDIERWFLARFRALRATVFTEPESFFRRFADLDDATADSLAGHIWRTINGVNLAENILPTRERADVVLEKGPDHAVRSVRLRTRAASG
jgi:type I pantothenate kinase